MKAPDHTSSKPRVVHIGEHLFHAFPIENGLKQGDALTPLLFNSA